MATFTFSSVADQFPVGTEVGAYLARYRRDGSSPSGSATDTATVASAGTLTFDGVADDTDYVAYASVNGAHRYRNFQTSRPRYTGQEIVGPLTDGDAPVWSTADDALVATPVATKTEAGSRTLTARRVLASGRLADASLIHPDAGSYTSTVSAGSAATSIASGVRIAPKRQSSTLIDVLGDPHFEYVGQRPGELDVSSSDMCFADFLTGGSGQAARDHWRPRWQYQGTEFEAYIRARTTTIKHRWIVDGLPLTADYVSTATTAGFRHMIKLAFPAAGAHVIELDIENIEFGGVYIEPAGSIRRAPTQRPKFAVLGDSIAAGAAGISYLDTWVRPAAVALGCDPINLAIGGTGILNNGGTASADWPSRVADVTAVDPDVLVVAGSRNDVAFGSSTAASYRTSASALYAALIDALPNTPIVVAGIWIGGDTLSSTYLDYENALRLAAADNDLPFISYVDPLNKIASTAAFAAGTYAVGDERLIQGMVFRCTSAHTDADATPDLTKWRSTGFITGTRASAGSGNAPTYIHTDNIHPLAPCHQALGVYMAGEVAAALAGYADGTYTPA